MAVLIKLLSPNLRKQQTIIIIVIVIVITIRISSSSSSSSSGRFPLIVIMPKPLSKKKLLSTLSPFVPTILSFLTDSVDLANQAFPSVYGTKRSITFS
jgi:hypothetical protein